jgi:hypothetical protein
MEILNFKYMFILFPALLELLLEVFSATFYLNPSPFNFKNGCIYIGKKFEAV